MPVVAGQALGAALAQWPGALEGLNSPEALETWAQSTGYVLPPRWLSLMAHCQGLEHPFWTAQWANPSPVGPLAPNALALLKHKGSGILALDTDPDERGHWCAWWLEPLRITRLASSWQSLADLINQGPEAFWHHLQGQNNPPTSFFAHEVPYNTGFHQWCEPMDRSVPIQALEKDGQSLRLDSWTDRFSTLPWFARRLKPGTPASDT